VENASYSMTICAERNAVLQAIAAGQRSFRSIAIVGGKTAEEARETPCVPCGACLQVLAETAMRKAVKKQAREQISHLWR
jgi:cytidine deaminase